MKLELIAGDITTLALDAIVNPANSSLLGGGGADGAIHKAAGPLLRKACEDIRRTTHLQGLPTGEAVFTEGFNLPARYVIHVVGPIYEESKNPKEELRATYESALKIAEREGFSSIGFPEISTGVFGFPKREAREVVKGVMGKFSFERIKDVKLVYFTKGDLEQARKLMYSRV
jgi:O-acetyl-ADP-ribose deacetylase